MKRYVISLLVLAALASQAFAANFSWSGADPNSNAINLPLNYWAWSGDDDGNTDLPDGNDAVKLNNEWQPECLVDETVDLEIDQLFINENKGPGGENPPIFLNVTGGRLAVKGLFRMAGDNATGGGDIKISGGVLNAKGWFEIGFRNPSNIYMTGGEIICNSKVFIGKDNTATAIGIINIDGGKFQIAAVDRLVFATAAANVINISDGAFVIEGNALAAIAPLIADGRIVSTKPDFGLEVTYDADNGETVVTATNSLVKAQNPTPANLATDVDFSAGVLTWEAGTQAAKHDVYIGFVADEIEAADTSSDLYQGRIELSQIDFDPVMGRTFYWRVDEVNADETEIWTGDLWSFRTTGYFVIDDFESYTSEVGNQVFESWRDGISYTDPVLAGNGTGSRVGYDDPNSININAYGQTMPFYYDNSGSDGKAFYSEISKTFETPQNFTVEEIQSLTFSFSGSTDNDVEALYIIIEDSAGNTDKVNYGSAAEDIAFGPIPDWDKGFEFNVDLGEVQAAGVDISAVKIIYIGIGDTEATEAGGGGLVFVDDVRIYSPRCVWDYTGDGTDPQYLQTGDFNHDCTVDMSDLIFLVDQWLDTEQTLNSTEPGAALVHYTFDSHTSGADIGDSSGNGFDMVNVDPNAIIPTTGGYQNGYATFIKEYKLYIPNAAFETITGQFTIAFWLKLPQAISEYENLMWVMENREWDQSLRVNLDPQSNIRLFSGAGGSESDGVTYMYTRNAADPQWVHYAFTKNVDIETSIIYENGIPVAFNYNTDTLIDGPGIAAGVAESAALGGVPTGDWGMFEGEIDEFYMFDYALSNEEVMHLAGVDQTAIPLPDNNADINDDKIVNIPDFAEMASEWLLIELWPVPLY